MKSFKSPKFDQKQLKPAEKPEDVTNYGLWHLGRRDHSTNELRIKLGRKTDNSQWIEEAIRHLQEMGYLDEKRFVDNFLRNCNEFKHYGPLRIYQEFRLKGVDKDIVSSAIENSEFDYFEAALNYLNKKYSHSIEDKKEKDRITRFLLNKGFSFDMIRYAFEEHLKEAE